MVILFFGDDIVGVRKKAHEHIRALEKNEATVSRVTAETYQLGMLGDLVGATSLFTGAQTFLLDTLSEDPLYIEDLLKNLELLVESKNIFIVLEGALTAPHKKEFLKHAVEHTEVQGETKIKFNTFSLTDALLNRDKRTLWLLLMRAWREGLKKEEVIGTLYWQVKMLRLAEKTKSAEEAGQKAFVYGKAKHALTKFSTGEVDQLSRELLSIYHDGHLGKCDIDVALEKWVLKL